MQETDLNASLRGGIAALAAALLGGCATAPGAAELVGESLYRTPIDTYDVVVTAVDGKGTPPSGRVFVEPGHHELTVQGPTTLGSRNLVAVKGSRLLSEFTVRFDHEEPLAICTPAAAG